MALFQLVLATGEKILYDRITVPNISLLSRIMLMVSRNMTFWALRMLPKSNNSGPITGLSVVRPLESDIMFEDTHKKDQIRHRKTDRENTRY